MSIFQFTKENFLSNKRLSRRITIILLIFTTIKLIILFVPKGVNFGVPLDLIGHKQVWLGADGENYVNGFRALLNEGFFSQDTILVYFSAGYPLFLFCLGLLAKEATLILALLVQTLAFSFSCWFFGMSMLGTRLRKYTTLVVLALICNPTLSLASLEIGYESLASSLYLLSLGTIMNFARSSEGNIYVPSILLGICFGILVALNGRFLISVLLLTVILLVIRKNKLHLIRILNIVIAVSLVFPLLLVGRNVVANDEFLISANLGETLRIGVGANASGGYPSGEKPSTPLECTTSQTSKPSELDREKIDCVVEWYKSNLGEVPQLTLRKLFYYWSPWYGPLWSGTTNRNMWKYFHPIQVLINDVDEFKFIFGLPGKLVSGVWMFIMTLIMSLGLFVLHKANGLEKLLGWGMFLAVLLSGVVSMFTIGDNRFRIPVMVYSLPLQVVGLLYLLDKGKTRLVSLNSATVTKP